MKKLVSIACCLILSALLSGLAMARDFAGTYALNADDSEGYLEIEKQKNGLYSAYAYEYYLRGDGRAGSKHLFVGIDGKQSGDKIIFKAKDSNAKVQVDFSNIDRISIKKISGEIIGWEPKYNEYTYKPYKN